MFIIFVMDVPGYDKAFDEFWRKHPSTKKENVHPNLSAADWGYLTQAIGYDRMMCMIKTLSLMLLFEAFMKCHEIPENCLDDMDWFLRSFLDQYYRGFPRKVGKQQNLIKNHLVLHLVRDIRRLGSPENFNSGPGEKGTSRSSQATWSKYPVQSGDL